MSPEARALLEEPRPRPIFTERRSFRRRAWDAAWPWVALAIVVAWVLAETWLAATQSRYTAIEREQQLIASQEPIALH